MHPRLLWICIPLAALIPACTARRGDSVTAAPASAPVIAAIGPCETVLIPHQGDGKTDVAIRHYQEIASRTASSGAIERLAWAFVAKARESADSGYYRLADECARCLDSREPGSLAALLVRGHALQSLHRFREAEEVARALIDKRAEPSPFEHGLLGDALLEQGRLAEAIAAYETMLDLRPGLESYSRAAHVRWLRGDAAGALDLYGLAARASSFHDPEPAAWVRSRIAALELEAGAAERALRTAGEVLERLPGHVPSLFVRGKALLARGHANEALAFLRACAEKSPIPEHLWALADVLRMTGDENGARAVEADLERSGAAGDPRSFSLYLATRGKSAADALRLAEAELRERADVHTHDALAWALLASGRPADASSRMEKALAEGTRDARLFLHAGAIDEELGRVDAARGWFARADALCAALLPSEADELRRRAGRLPR